MFKEIFDSLSGLVYPRNCIHCKTHLNPSNPQTPRGSLCLACQSSVQYNQPPFCLKCSRHLNPPITHPTCSTCRKMDPYFDFAWGACLYDDLIRHLLHSFKYHQKTYLRFTLSQYMIMFVKTHHLDIDQFDMILPIPLFPTRLRERGYNQAAMLAHIIAQEFKIPINEHVLFKTRHTKYQTLLSQKERWTNIAGAFTIKNSKAIAGQSILLVDDLLTTGATVSVAAQTLKTFGARKVGVLTAAIAK